MTRIKFLKIIAFINSLISIWPVVWLIERLATHGFLTGKANIWQLMDDQYNLYDIIVIAFAAVVMISNAIIGSYLFKKTSNSRNLLLAFLGGNIFYILFAMIPTKEKRNKGIKKILAGSFGVTMAAGSLPSLGYSIYEVTNLERLSNIDTASYIKDESFEFSLDKKHPNVIDLFTDGLDFNFFQKAMNDDKWNKLNDFTFYPKFVETGFETDRSTPMLMSGDDRYIRDYKVPRSRDKYYQEAISYRNGGQLNHIGNIDTGPTGFYDAWSGNWKHFTQNFPDVNNLNWVKANEILSAGGINKYSPEYAPYKAFIERMKPGRASYSKLDDTITHGPIHTNEFGHFTMFGNVDASYKALTNFLVELRDKLSSIVDPANPGYSAYDNTTIFVYGDHGSHTITWPIINQNPEGNIYRKNQSALFVKPLKEFVTNSKPRNINLDREIWAPFYRRILRKALIPEQNGAYSSPLEFINTNINFDSGHNFGSTMGDYAYFSKYDENNILQSSKIDGLTNGWTQWHSDIYNRLFVEEQWK